MGNFISKPIIGATVASCLTIGSFGIYQLFNEKSDKKGKLALNEQELAEYPLERVIQILQDLRVEFTPVLIHWFNVYNKLKEQSQAQIKDPDKALAFITQKIDVQIKSTQMDVCKKYGIDHDRLVPLLSYYQSENKKIQELQNVIMNAIRDTINGKRPDLKLVIPESLTKAMYIKVYSRLLYTLRHHHYMKIREKIRERGGEVDKNQLKEIGNLKFSEEIRGKVFDYYKIQKEQNEDYHRTLKKAFYSYYQDKEFQNQIDVIQKYNHKILSQIVNGQIVEGMEQDPFEVDDQVITEQIKAPARNVMNQLIQFLNQSSKGGEPRNGPEVEKVEEDQDDGDKNQPKIKALDDDDEDADYEDVDQEEDNHKDQNKQKDEDFVISSTHEDLPRRQDYEGDDADNKNKEVKDDAFDDDKKNKEVKDDAFEEDQKVEVQIKDKAEENPDDKKEGENRQEEAQDKKVQAKDLDESGKEAHVQDDVNKDQKAQEEKKAVPQDAFEQQDAFQEQDAYDQQDNDFTKDEPWVPKEDDSSAPAVSLFPGVKEHVDVPPHLFPAAFDQNDNSNAQVAVDQQQKLEEKNNEGDQQNGDKDAFDE